MAEHRRAGVRRSSDGEDLLKGAAAGLIGGLVASFAMNEFQRAWTWAIDGSAPQSSGDKHDGRDWQERNEDENATEQVAQAISRRTIERRLTRDELEVAAPAVHYGFGALMGTVYGVIAERSSRITAVGGAGYGALIWALADEVAVPAFGFSRPSTEFPLETHAQALAAHLVYGMTTEGVRRGMRSQM